MAQKNVFFRSIRLTPALGDWTILKSEKELEEKKEVSTLKRVRFDRFSREDLKFLHNSHYRLAEKIARKLSNDMQMNVELYSVDAEQIAYEEYINKQQDLVVQVDLKNEMGKVSLVFEWGVADLIVNRLSGGPGQESGGDVFSDLEKEILKMQVKEMVPFIAALWPSFLEEEKVQWAWVQGNDAYKQKMNLRESYVFFTFSFLFGSELSPRKLSLAYSSEDLDRFFLRQGQRDLLAEEQISLEQNTLKKIKVPVKVNLGKSLITMGDLRGLEVGDVVTFENMLNDPVEIVADGEVKLEGYPVFRNNHNAVQIVASLQAQEKEALEEEVEEEDIELEKEDLDFEGEEFLEDEDISESGEEQPGEEIAKESVDFDEEEEIVAEEKKSEVGAEIETDEVMEGKEEDFSWDDME
jgi:flagellar motor switch protein FliM